MAKFDANWWFGKNSVWQQSGIGKGVETSTGGFLSGITSFFSGISKPEVTVKHGADETGKLLLAVIVLMAFMRK
tara:strand:- start:2770 stop:2991 length:222 start_codon:yes stop_codon:yes gene_type:complete